MEDLFGHQMDVYRGHPIEAVHFTDQEAEVITEDVVYGGALIEQLGRDLKKVATLTSKGKGTVINNARREAWSGLMWCFDLWESPADLPFDTACELAGADSENIRNSISVRFADEIRLMFGVITSHFPEEVQRIRRRLSAYVDLSIH